MQDSNNKVPEFEIRTEKNDVNTRITVQQAQDGYFVRHRELPIHFDSLEDAAEAVKQGILNAKWPKQKGGPDEPTS